MFQLAGYSTLQYVDYAQLRCECGMCRFIEMSNVKTHEREQLTLKKAVLPLVCEYCGKEHTNPVIYLEPQGIRPGVIAPRKKPLLHRILDAMSSYDPNDPNFYPADND